MKLIVLLMMLISTSAFASKARISALQGATFLTDIQFMLVNPGQINHLNTMANYELGGNTTASTPKSEGGIIRDNVVGGKAAIFLGHLNPAEKTLRNLTTVTLEENPVMLVYGKDNWGASVSISKSDKKPTAESQESLIGSFGFDKKDWEVYGTLILISKAEKANNKYSSSPFFTVGGEYHWKNNYYAHGELNLGNVDRKVGGADSDAKVFTVDATFFDRTLRKGKMEVYYGPGLSYESLDVEGKKISGYSIPFYVGLTHQTKDWMELRASISQNMILGRTKDETKTTPADKESTIANNTTVAVGAGFKMGELLVDTTFAGSTTGNVNGNELLANVGLTFNF